MSDEREKLGLNDELETEDEDVQAHALGGDSTDRDALGGDSTERDALGGDSTERNALGGDST